MNDFAKGLNDLTSVINRLLGPAAPEFEGEAGDELPEACPECHVKVGDDCQCDEREDHDHTCQQCDTMVIAHCDCKTPQRNIWCSSNCRAAFDL